jgi:outer membrane protein assembly factor BamE (lipoprotein component of BamABCDE complex)
MKRAAAVILTACLLLPSCMTSGRRIDKNDLSWIRTGTTTREQVHTVLGPPTSRMSRSDGSSVESYAYVHAQVKGQSFIPFAGAFVGGTRVNQTSTTFTYGADGTVLDYMHGGTNAESTGFRVQQTAQ